jgi:hypothetical protein
MFAPFDLAGLRPLPMPALALGGGDHSPRSRRMFFATPGGAGAGGGGVRNH